MRILTKEQIKEVAAEITHSDLPLKTQKFLIDLVNEVNKKVTDTYDNAIDDFAESIKDDAHIGNFYCDDEVDEIAKQLKGCKNERY